MIYRDVVTEVSTSVGVGDFVLAGAVPGFISWALAGVADNEVVDYAIRHQSAIEFEAGSCTYHTAGSGSITRNTVTRSSNANALVNFSGGTKWVVLTLSERLMNKLSNLPSNVLLGAIVAGEPIGITLGTGLEFTDRSLQVSKNVQNPFFLFSEGGTGEDGMTIVGPTGATGTTGTTGLQGIPGNFFIGDDGTPGEDGMTIVGPVGATGTTGTTGLQGIPGNFFIGDDGMPGEDGMTVVGATGATGASGVGQQGIPGNFFPGADGEPAGDGYGIVPVVPTPPPLVGEFVVVGNAAGGGTATGTLTFPGWATYFEVEACSAGGGGGSGRKGATLTSRSGGNGGNGGNWGRRVYKIANMGLTGNAITYSIGAPGAGGAAITASSTNGNPGTGDGIGVNVLAASVNIFTLAGGNAGNGGTVAANVANTANTIAMEVGSLGGFADTVGAVAPLNTWQAPGGGGQGASIKSDNTVVAGGAGGQPKGISITNTSPAPANEVIPGSGGAGGATTGNAGAVGFAYGAGGGGGAAGLNATTDSGKGGDGGQGILRVRYW